MAKLKVAIVGNCQVRPLANNIVKLLECEVNLVAIVHLLKNDDEASVHSKLAEADIIISQLISDNYPAKFVSTNFLRSIFGSRLICIPNMFYMGYTPDLHYMRLPGSGTLQGPLCDYHSRIIFNAWESGLSKKEALSEYENKENWEHRYSNSHNDSVLQLKLKEQMTDINISDVIENNVGSHRLFFTFNHPTNYLILCLLKRIVNLIGELSKKIEDKADLISSGNESLNQFIVPLSDFVIDNLNIKNVNKEYQIFQGLVKNQENNRFFKVQYSLEQLIEEYYKKYDENKENIKKLLVK